MALFFELDLDGANYRKGTVSRRGLPAVNLSLVLPGVSRQGERLTAHATGVLPLPHVDQEVLCEIELVPEGSSTDLARVRLVVIQVQLAMPRQRKVIPELPATQGALVGFFARVDPLVLDEILLLPEALAA